MNITVYDDAEKFLVLVMPLLQADEARNNLMLGVCLSLGDYTDPEGQQPYLGCVQDGEVTALACVMTPPFNLLLFSPLAAPPQSAYEALIDSLQANNRTIPGARGESSLVQSFVHLYTARSGRQAHLKMRQRAFMLTEVIQTSLTPGVMRPAQATDLPRMIDLMTGFSVEVSPEDSLDHIENIAHRLIERGLLFLWEVDGRPVSIAFGNRPTPNGIAISGVYTLPDARGRGVASALVAGLSQHFLDSGRQFCTLFTDLANPTSNHIYQQIGYQSVGDFSIYRFE